MNLTIDGDSDYVDTGTPDSATPVSDSTDGSDGTDLVADLLNGLLVAVPDLQALLGNALTLKGTVADLATRLSRTLQDTGALRSGSSFPGSPIAGQPFWRTDQALFYVYDAVSGQWVLGQDNPLYALLDGSREYTGVIKVEMSVPGLRLRGLEVSGRDIFIAESGGVLHFYDNTGTEGVPIWVSRFSINMATGALTITGAHSGALITANTIPAASLVNGSLSQTQMGSACIGTGQLKTATGSAAVVATDNTGAGASTGANVTMNDYGFGWVLTFAAVATGSGAVAASNGQDGPVNIADPGTTVPRRSVVASVTWDGLGSAGAQCTATMRWRYMTASDNPDVWVIADPLTGEILASWWSDDPIPGGEIPIAMKGYTATRLTDSDLAKLPIPNEAVDAALEEIVDNDLKLVNLDYRAIQKHAGDTAPAGWLTENVKIDKGQVALLTEQEKSERGSIGRKQ